MPKQYQIVLPVPTGGLSEYASFEESSLTTMRDAQNVRAHDPRTGRNRLAQRAGMSKYMDAQVNGPAAIQNLTQFVYTTNPPPIGGGQILTSPNPGATLNLIDNTGVIVASFTPARFSGAIASRHACWDQGGNVYFTYRDSQASSLVGLEARASDGTLLWNVDTGLAASGGPAVQGLAVFDGTLYLMWRDDSPLTTTIYRYNALTGSLVDSPFWASTSNSTLTNTLASSFDNTVRQAIAVAGNRVAFFGTTANTVMEIRNIADVSLVATVTIRTGATDLGTAGSLFTDNDLGFYVVCESSADNGRTMLIGFDGAISYTVLGNGARGGDYDFRNKRLVICGANLGGMAGRDVGFANRTTGVLSSTADIAQAGTLTFVQSDAAGGMWAASSGTVAIDHVTSALANDFDTAAIVGDELVAANTNPQAVATAGQRKTIQLAVAGGTVKQFTPDGTGSVINGSGAFSVTRRQILSAQNGANVFFADGLLYRYYEPESNTVLTWTPTAGSLPVDAQSNRATLIATWRGRTVLSGVKLDPQNWFMSAVDDPFDWDTSPATVTLLSAVAGNSTALATGQMGDVVTALIPYNDDTLILLGDHTVYVMSGDPREGGRLDNVSDRTGGAGPKAWVRVPDGAIFFFGTRGGVWKMNPPVGQPERITATSLDERFADVDPSLFVIDMAWSQRLQGFFLMLTPIDGSATTHYFYDYRNQSWWPDVFQDSDLDPFVIAEFDADEPTDRAVLFGGQDGYVRKVDPDAKDDDAFKIDSYAVLGPMRGKGAKLAKLTSLQAVLGSESDRVEYSVRRGLDSEEAFNATAIHTGTWLSQRNPADRRGADGVIYLKVGNSLKTEAFALESLIVEIAATSRAWSRRS